jgi:hypothetical protein
MRLPLWSIKLFFTANLVIFVLLLFTVPFLEPGTGSFVAATLTFVIVLTGMALAGLTVFTYRWLDERHEAD